MAKGKTKKQNPTKVFIFGAIGVLLVIILGFLAYSAYTFTNSDEQEKGFVVCNPDKTICTLSQHIHADIEVNVCGEDITFEREKGLTTEMHTHKERNYMHWHDQIKIDPITQEVLPEERDRITVQAFLNQMEFTFPTSCPGNPKPTLTMMVNEVENEQRLQYVWVDGDDILIEYK